ncbi:YgfZ/GcvT domain-containing protein [Candidatus Poriferisodalis sp.]|uniref:YgfZ/GcvT domain-containing protein n=1 Tax=Candidatus Poriferisodalis sp. TaxID=3101277 RepID=UPI003B5C2C4D
MTLQPQLDRLVVATIPRDVVAVSGPEATVYLHGQISADVTALDPGESTLSFLLEPRGRVEALFAICRTGPDTYVADTEPGFGEAMATSLERFKLRTRVEFTPQQWQMHSLRGPASAVDALQDAVNDATVSSSLVVRRSNWPLAAGFDVLAPAQSAERPDLAAVEVISADEYDILRMAFGLPAMGAEIVPGDIPNETGLVDRAASFTKGCYRGQELVERIDSRAGGRRSVCRFRASVPLAPDDQLHDGTGTAVATVRNAAALGDAVVGFVLARRDAGNTAYTTAGEPVLLAELF